MMVQKLKVVLIAILIFVALFIVTQFFLPDKYVVRIFSRTGVLRVESIPKTNVFVNSNLYGQTPLQVNLKEGVYALKLVPESKDAQLISYSETIKIHQGTTTYINRELSVKDLQSGGEILSLEKAHTDASQIWVNTEPAGVFVSLDGDDRGISPVFMDNVSPGTHELTVHGERFLPRTIKINTVVGYKLLADFKLVMDQSAVPTPKAKAKNTTKIQKLVILNTPLGYLRVREEPSLNASESAQVNPGDEFTYYEEQDNWYQIEYDANKRGWVYGEYVDLVTPTPTPTPTPEEE